MREKLKRLERAVRPAPENLDVTVRFVESDEDGRPTGRYWEYHNGDRIECWGYSNDMDNAVEFDSSAMDV